MDELSPAFRSEDKVWQQEKGILAGIIAQVSPVVRLAAGDVGGIVSVPMENSCISPRAVVICTAGFLGPQARLEIKRRVARSRALQGRGPFEVLFRTGEMTLEFAEAIGASRQWIGAAWAGGLLTPPPSPPPPLRQPAAATSKPKPTATATAPRGKLPQRISRIKPPSITKATPALAPRSTMLPRPGGGSSAPKQTSASPAVEKPKSMLPAPRQLKAPRPVKI